MRFHHVFFILTIPLFFLRCDQEKKISLGVSYDLAQSRISKIDKVFYDLSFDIPSLKSDPVNVRNKINFELSNLESDIALDFSVPEESVLSIEVNGSTTEINLLNGHLIIASKYLKKGQNEVIIKAVSGDQSLNRNDDFLYTLFVPDRASSAFPCFDQPDIKAKYKVQLSIPSSWKAITAAKLEMEELNGSTKTLSYEWSESMSSYLFSFVAGDFKKRMFHNNDLDMTMLYREDDESLVNRNVKEIYDLHLRSIEWLETYTGIEFPYSKLDFVVIPGFQYGGMEHVGAIQYREKLLFLDQSASLKKKLRRANLIAHETAHMWFGNLVTMKWFDDVWMKEVFANFMADKIVKEVFPEVNHDLNFLFAHYPDAYSVDRTEGANAIRQPLDNLSNAGNMYGSIIYHKAPIAMRQLELMVGENEFRFAIQEYLENYSHNNANWDDLSQIVQRVSGKDIPQWSEVWIKGAGRPYFDLELTEGDIKAEFNIRQIDALGQNRIWPQVWDASFDYTGGPVDLKILMDQQSFSIRRKDNAERASFIQLNSDGLGYGVFSQGLAYVRDEFLFDRSRIDISGINEDLKRGAAYLNMHEFLLEKGFHPQLYYTFLEIYIEAEKNDLILSYLLENIELIFNRFLNYELQKQHVANLEITLWNKLNAVNSQALKSTILESYLSIVQTESGINRMKDIWEGRLEIDGLELSKNQKEKLALSIALKSVDGMRYLDQQIEATTNADARAKLLFIKPVFSGDPIERNSFFEKLKDPENRAHETWVLLALTYLHHPFRNEVSIDLILPSLEMLEDIRVTGDIFFPKAWMDRVLSGYNSREAVVIVQQFIDDNPDLNYHLKMKLLQSSDMLFRAEKNLDYYQKLKFAQ